MFTPAISMFEIAGVFTVIFKWESVWYWHVNRLYKLKKARKDVVIIQEVKYNIKRYWRKGYAVEFIPLGIIVDSYRKKVNYKSENA